LLTVKDIVFILNGGSFSIPFCEKRIRLHKRLNMKKILFILK
jgi:hypothetical protein